MKAKIEIKMENAAFEGRTRSELARILRKMAEALEYEGTLNNDTKLPAIDTKGNTVGHLTITGKPE